MNPITRQEIDEMGYTEENLWYILDLLNYRYELMREYRE